MKASCALLSVVATKRRRYQVPAEIPSRATPVRYRVVAFKTGATSLWVIAAAFILIGAFRYMSMTRFQQAKIEATDVVAAQRWELEVR